MTATLRPAVAADYEAVASWIPDRTACLRWAGPNVSFPFSADELPLLLELPGGESCCLVDGRDRPMGFGQYQPRGQGSVHLLRVIVAPASRGQGLGRDLCSRLVARAAAATSASTVTLNVYRDNTAALALYESLGFAVMPAESARDSLFMARERPRAAAALRRQAARR